MKIKIKYELLDTEGQNSKSYTKTFGEVKDQTSPEEAKTFADAYLSLVEDNGNGIKYEIFKSLDELITTGSI